MFFQYLGYFFIMLIFMILAIVTAKTKAAWILYITGAVVQLLSLIGIQKAAQIYGGTDVPSGYAICYILLLAISAVLIAVRRSKANDATTEETHNEASKEDCKEESNVQK